MRKHDANPVPTGRLVTPTYQYARVSFSSSGEGASRQRLSPFILHRLNDER